MNGHYSYIEDVVDRVQKHIHSHSHTQICIIYFATHVYPTHANISNTSVKIISLSIEPQAHHIHPHVLNQFCQYDASGADGVWGADRTAYENGYTSMVYLMCCVSVCVSAGAFGKTTGKRRVAVGGGVVKT